MEFAWDSRLSREPLTAVVASQAVGHGCAAMTEGDVVEMIQLRVRDEQQEVQPEDTESGASNAEGSRMTEYA